MLLKSALDVNVNTSMFRQVCTQVTCRCEGHCPHHVAMILWAECIILMFFSCQTAFHSDLFLTGDCNEAIGIEVIGNEASGKLPTADWTGAALDAETQSCSGSAADMSSPHMSLGLQVQAIENQQVCVSIG